MKMGMKRTLFEISLFRKYQMSESLLDQFGNNNNITTINSYKIFQKRNALKKLNWKLICLSKK